MSLDKKTTCVVRLQKEERGREGGAEGRRGGERGERGGR